MRGVLRNLCKHLPPQRWWPPARFYRSRVGRVADRDFFRSLGGQALLLPSRRPLGDRAQLLPVSDPKNQQRRSFLCFVQQPKHYEEDRIMGYSPEQLFEVAAGVDFYQDFVPWCQKSVVSRRKGDHLEADLQIGYKLFEEKYTSRVELKRPSLVKTTVGRTEIFEYLNNLWEITPGPVPGSCHLHFVVDFQFKSFLYNKVANVFLDEVVTRLVSAFENRCFTIYGPPKSLLHLPSA